MSISLTGFASLSFGGNYCIRLFMLECVMCLKLEKKLIAGLFLVQLESVGVFAIILPAFFLVNKYLCSVAHGTSEDPRKKECLVCGIFNLC